MAVSISRFDRRTAVTATAFVLLVAVSLSDRLSTLIAILRWRVFGERRGEGLGGFGMVETRTGLAAAVVIARTGALATLLLLVHVSSRSSLLPHTLLLSCARVLTESCKQIL